MTCAAEIRLNYHRVTISTVTTLVMEALRSRMSDALLAVSSTFYQSTFSQIHKVGQLCISMYLQFSSLVVTHDGSKM